MLPTIKNTAVRGESRLSTIDYRLLMSVGIVFAMFSLFFMPPAAQAVSISCSQVGSKLGISASCANNCGNNAMNLTDALTGLTGVDSTTFCPSTQSCCATEGVAFCEGFTNSLNVQGTCRTSFCNPSSETQFSFAGGNPCGNSGYCCVVGKASITPQNVASLLAVGATKPTSTTPSAAPLPLPDPLGGVNIPTLIGNIVRTFTGIAGSLALLMFVYGGVMYILSGGEQAAVQKAKTILFNASIGIVLIFLAYLLTSTIINAMLAT